MGVKSFNCGSEIVQMSLAGKLAVERRWQENFPPLLRAFFPGCQAPSCVELPSTLLMHDPTITITGHYNDPPAAKIKARLTLRKWRMSLTALL
jgi:hypothetical protein